MWHERRQGIDRGCGQPISYNNNCLIHVQMTRDVHTVEALVIGSQCAPNWRVCSKRMQARCHEEILWQNLLLITNCLFYHNLSLPPFPTQCHNTSHSDTLQVHITWPLLCHIHHFQHTCQSTSCVCHLTCVVCSTTDLG